MEMLNIEVPETVQGSAKAGPGLAGQAYVTQQLSDLGKRYGFVKPEQAAVAANLAEGVDDDRRQQAREYLKEHAKLAKVDESYDAATGLVVTKSADGRLLSIRNVGAAVDSAKAEKERFEYIKSLATTFIPLIKGKKSQVLNQDERAEFISQAVTLTNQIPGATITLDNMPQLVYMFKLQKALSMEEDGEVKFTSLAPAYNLVKAGGKYLDEETAKTTLLKAAGMEAEARKNGDKNFDAGQAVKLITAPDHPITGHLIKNNMDPAMAVHITDRIEARVEAWRAKHPDDTTSTVVLAQQVLNEMIKTAKRDENGKEADKVTSTARAGVTYTPKVIP